VPVAVRRLSHGEDCEKSDKGEMTRKHLGTVHLLPLGSGIWEVVSNELRQI